ncbi:nuclear transport factor 2 family protein [Aquimarina gracilis]|uniref:Nuclear transport factor 2 family protein n=1 Tax=Aquimarina gracilis TaxID=874422 RepID=A0ABU5ZV07_9FLAO|nr:nuclear transport factor 2 family protein [Aquimarina gracilis]MEB3345091.1 nuclear transport factor 2 family protein [Aquimarina gracilis]
MSTINQIWEVYRACWNVTDPQERMNKLEKIMTNDFEYHDPNVTLKGHEQLAEYMEQFQKEFKGMSFVISDFNFHHNRSLAHWNMVDEKKEMIANGIDFAYYKNGRIQQITGFFKEN